jgi:hypothetical protein
MSAMSETPRIDEHALSNLRFIRDAMERATTFTSIPGWGGVGVGVTALAAAVLASRFVGDALWLSIWLVEALIAAAIGGATMVRKARRAGVSFRGAAARRFFVSYFAPLVAAAAITGVLVRAQVYDALPPIWLLLYGVSFVSSGAYSIPLVPLMGFCFVGIGFIACFTHLWAGNALLGAGFGGLHIVFGFMIARSHGG